MHEQAASPSLSPYRPLAPLAGISRVLLIYPKVEITKKDAFDLPQSRHPRFATLQTL